MIFCFCAIVFFVGAVSSEFNMADFLMQEMPKGSMESESDERIDKELKKFYKHLTNQEVKFFKKKFRQELEDDEKNQVKYFEDILNKVKHLSKDKFSLGDVLERINDSEKEEKEKKDELMKKLKSNAHKEKDYSN